MSFGRFVSFDRDTHTFLIDVDNGQDIKDTLYDKLLDLEDELNAEIAELERQHQIAKNNLKQASDTAVFLNNLHTEGPLPESVKEANDNVLRARIELEKIRIPLDAAKVNKEAAVSRASQIAFVDATLELQKVKALHYITRAEEEALQTGDTIRVYAINRELDILYSDGVLVDDAWLQENGRFIHPLLQDSKQLFYNAAVLPGFQRYKKIYRQARVKNVTRDPSDLSKICDVDILVNYSKAQALPTFTELKYFDVPCSYTRDAFLWFEDVCVLDFDLTTDSCTIVGSHDGIYEMPPVWSDGSYRGHSRSIGDVNVNPTIESQNRTITERFQLRAINRVTGAYGPLSEIFEEQHTYTWEKITGFSHSLGTPQPRVNYFDFKFYVDEDLYDFSQGVEFIINGRTVLQDGYLSNYPELPVIPNTNNLNDRYDYSFSYSDTDALGSDYGIYLNERQGQNFAEIDLSFSIDNHPVVTGYTPIAGYTLRTQYQEQNAGIDQRKSDFFSGWIDPVVFREVSHFEESMYIPPADTLSDYFTPNWIPAFPSSFPYIPEIRVATDAYALTGSGGYVTQFVNHSFYGDTSLNVATEEAFAQFMTTAQAEACHARLFTSNKFQIINMGLDVSNQRASLVRRLADEFGRLARVTMRTLADGKTVDFNINLAAAVKVMDHGDTNEISGGYQQYIGLYSYEDPRWRYTLRGLIPTNQSTAYPEVQQSVISGNVYIPSVIGHVENLANVKKPLKNNL